MNVFYSVGDTEKLWQGVGMTVHSFENDEYTTVDEIKDFLKGSLKLKIFKSVGELNDYISDFYVVQTNQCIYKMYLSKEGLHSLLDDAIERGYLSKMFVYTPNSDGCKRMKIREVAEIANHQQILEIISKKKGV